MQTKGKGHPERYSKAGEYQAALDKFGGKEKWLGSHWKVIIAFGLPCYQVAKALKNYQTIPKTKTKVDKLRKEKGTPWTVFVVEELLKTCADM